MQAQGHWRRVVVKMVEASPEPVSSYGVRFDLVLHAVGPMPAAGAGWFVRDVHVAAAEMCDNGMDDNGDGQADCNDPLCGLAPGCVETSCTNGKDDNGDGQTDCQDQACEGSPDCP